MANAFSVATKILGEDLASEVFRKVGSAAKSAFKPINAFNDALAKPETYALGRVGNAVDKVGAKFRSGLHAIAAWLPALGAIGTAASIGGLIEMSKKAAEGFEGLTLGAEKLGVSTKDLALWRFGAKMTGVESEAMEKGLVKLKKAMYDAATGKNKDVAALFTKMGISLRDAQGHVKNVDAALPDLTEAFKNTTDEETKSRAALALFGKAGADLIPFLNRGREGLSEWSDELKKYSGLTQQNRADLSHLAESYKHLDKAGSGLSTKLSAVFAPVMAKVIDLTVDWINANRDAIAQALERKIDNISKAFGKLASGMNEILQVPWIAEFTKGGEASHLFEVALGLLGVSMLGPVLAGFQAVTGSVIALNRAMFANPAVAVGAILIGVAIELVAHWGEVKQAFSDAYDKWGEMGVVFELVNVPVNLLFAAINDVSKALFGIDMEKWSKGFDEWVNHALDAFLDRIDRMWKRITDLKNIFSFATSSAGADVPNFAGAPLRGAGGDGPRAHQMMMPGIGLYPSAPAPDSPAAQAALGKPAPTELVISGEIKAPPGSTITATTRGGGTQVTPLNVGRSMHDNFGA